MNADKKEFENLILKKINEQTIKQTEWNDESARSLIKGLILTYSRNFDLNEEDKKEAEKTIFNKIRRMDFLQPLLDDDSVTDIMINGTREVFVEKNNRLISCGELFRDEEQIENLIEKICNKAGREVNTGNPLVDARLPDGSRIAVVLPPVSINGATIAIRKFSKKILTLDDLLKSGSIDEEAVNILRKAIKEKKNIFLSGGTGSGKTTILNMLCNEIDDDERIVTVEDSAELRINKSNIVKLQTRNPNSEGIGAVDMRSLVKMALRLRPDRIIVGEVRGRECLDMLQAMHTGHAGFMSSGHSNSAEDMLSRLLTMALMADIGLSESAIKRQIGSGINIIVHMKRLDDGNRVLYEIAEVLNWENERPDIKKIYKRDL